MAVNKMQTSKYMSLLPAVPYLQNWDMVPIRKLAERIPQDNTGPVSNTSLGVPGTQECLFYF